MRACNLRRQRAVIADQRESVDLVPGSAFAGNLASGSGHHQRKEQCHRAQGQLATGLASRSDAASGQDAAEATCSVGTCRPYLQRLTAEARVACWIDWYGLQMADTNPRQKGTVITSGRSLADVLQFYANKFEMVFALEDNRTIWATSPEMHRLQPRLYVLPLAQKSLEEWTAELESLAPINPATGASMLKLIPTPDGQFLFVRCCRPILVGPIDSAVWAIWRLRSFRSHPLPSVESVN